MPQDRLPRASRSAHRERRWRVPPPLLHGPETLEGAEVLEEMRNPLGLLLWRCVRDVNLWCMSETAEARSGLFSPEAAPRHLAGVLSTSAATELREPLEALSSMLEHPADVAPELVMLACARISQWAERSGATGTALAWAQAAALACPASAYAALRVGKLARRRGEHARAEGWLQRAIVLARQGNDRASHAAAYTALGNLRFVRGNMPAAERCHRRALRIARRFGLRQHAAAALHDLFVVCAELGRSQEAVLHAHQALLAYGPGHERLPALAHDVAHFWMLQGNFAPALPVLVAVSPHAAPHQRAIGLANIARAAGVLGERATFDRYWTSTLEIVERAEHVERHPAALLDLAMGAASLQDWDRAEFAASRALRLATELEEHKTYFAADALLQSVRARSAAPTAAGSTPRTAEQEDQLARQLVDCLAGADA